MKILKKICLFSYLAFSLFLIVVYFGIFLEAGVYSTYGGLTEEDAKYIFIWSFITLIYLILNSIICIIELCKKSPLENVNPKLKRNR